MASQDGAPHAQAHRPSVVSTKRKRSPATEPRPHGSLDRYVPPCRTPAAICSEINCAGERLFILEQQLGRALAHHDTSSTIRRRDDARRQLQDLTVELEASLHQAWPLVIIPCGGVKRDGTHPVDRLYTGSYHAACKRAALRLTVPDRVRVLSALYGFLRLHDYVRSYNVTMGGPGSIDTDTLMTQAAGITGRVIVIAGRRYAAAALAVFPDAELPLAGCRGIGEQLARMKTLG